LGALALGMVGAAALRAQAPPAAAEVRPPRDASSLLREDEKHLRNLRQLTFGGENAEAYWSPDGTKLILQSRAESDGCDQEYVLDVATGARRRVSTGQGRTTCG
jgi:dipeptidyl aminopeptidase/acylaminoacyl peptidase